MVGLLASFVGGLLVGVAYYGGILLTADAHQLASSPPQWPVVILGGVAGFMGSLVDSCLGATVQYSGQLDCHFLENIFSKIVF